MSPAHAKRSTMKGKVVLVNPKRRAFVVEIETGDFDVFEMVSGDCIEVGDVISGRLDALPCEALTNETRGQIMAVLPRGLHCSGVVAQEIAFC